MKMRSACYRMIAQTATEGNEMSDFTRQVTYLPPQQETIRAQYFHPSRVFTEFTKEEIAQCIPERFEKMVRLYPDRIAVKVGKRSLTYVALNQAANQIARAILETGRQENAPIALVFESGIDIIAAILGVLKAGKVYVPLDPLFPMVRNADVLADSEPSVIVTNTENLPLARTLARGKLALINVDEHCCSYAVDNPTVRLTPDALAYILYTSGTTGKPKGVVQNHRNVLHLVMRHTNRAHISPRDRIALLRSFHVHGGTLLTFAALLNGAMILPFDTKREGVQALAHWLAREEITLCRMGPTAFRHLAAILREEDRYPQLREMSFSGEPLHKSDVELCRQHFSEECVVVNSYGSTEVSSCCEYHVDRQACIEDGLVPCGYPTSDMSIVLLEEDGRETPCGDIGEISVKSRYLALEYWRNPELTRAKFIPVPDGGGERIYLSGDLGRMLSDGRLVHVGRKDFQLKIRGYRIEVSEVESALLALDNIKEAVVVGRKDRALGERLVAYIVPGKKPAPSTITLRRSLQEQLPDYMVPGVFVVLDRLPLTPNGKPDRKALPDPGSTRPELSTPFIAPRTLAEERLANVWAGVLGIDQVGIHDDFFDLGGHSLAAAQVVSGIRDSFDVELPLRNVFESPTLSGLAERIEEARMESPGPTALPILPLPFRQECPQSFSQERFWFLSQLEPDSSAYNNTYGFRLAGSLNTKALKHTLEEIVRRHEVLRTTFALRHGEPVQIIGEQCSVDLPIMELTQGPEVDLDAEVQRQLENEHRRPFNLSSDLMLRASLLRLKDDEHVLFLSIHHIAFDHWSIKILYRELSVIYQAFSAGKPSPLPELPVQYGDYAIWQRKMLHSGELEDHLAYWKRQLNGAPSELNLPTNHPRTRAHTSRGAARVLVLSKPLSNALKALSQQVGVTLFMTLLAALKTLLHRLTGQEDIVVGTPIAGRDRSETGGLIGLFLNTLALRTGLSDNPTFLELVTRVREVALGAYDHRDVPFEKLVVELRPKRDLNRPPLFQVLFNMYNYEDSELSLDGLSVRSLNTNEPVSMFDLTVYVRERADATHLRLVYNADVFGHTGMSCVLQQYVYLLDQVVSAPEKPIRSYSLVTPESRQWLPDPSRVIVEPAQELVMSRFASWARRAPQREAVSQGGQTWTYGELAERAENLARVLRARGVERGDVVAIYGRRSFGLIAAMMGTLASGGVLLPLDCELPARRKGLMLREARAKKLLYVGDRGAREAWLEADAIPDILCVDPAKGCAIDARIGLDLESTTLPKITADDAAYIFFTSGTTGVPKGVLGCHKGLSHFLQWQCETFAIGPNDRIAQLTSLSFDVVLRDIFLPVTTGGTLCLPEAVDALGPDDLFRWLERERITILHAVPTLAQSWLANMPAGVSLPHVRWVFFAGEPLTDTLVKHWRTALPRGGEIVNLYGPNETTLAKCFYQVPAETLSGVQPVGRPLPQTQALVLAGNNQLCGINESGEIALRTPFRSLGYVNAPEENQRRFVQNPFRDDVQDLICFTGDAGRYRPDGTLEILGRLDDQVKMRGVRVEPDEVAAILARHPAVESCFVAAMKNDQDPTCLVAYVVASRSEKATSTQLRSYLGEHLPTAMLPAFFVFLDSLPLTINGKVDRRSLPQPDQSRPEIEQGFVAPRTLYEKILAEMWAGLLKLEKVGIHDNFFDLGGHSLLATQVISRIRQSLQIDVPLRTVFEAPTIQQMAAICAEHQANNLSETGFLGMLTELDSVTEEEAQRLLTPEGDGQH